MVRIESLLDCAAAMLGPMSRLRVNQLTILSLHPWFVWDSILLFFFLGGSNQIKKILEKYKMVELQKALEMWE